MSALELYIDPARLTAWHARAHPGEAVTYAIAETLDHANAAVLLVDRWIAEGSVVPTQRRDRGILRREVQRCARTAEPGGRPALRVERFTDKPEAVLLAELERLAAAGLPCPSNAQIGRTLGWDRRKVQYRLQLLEEGRRVRVTSHGGPFDGRTIKITATGQSIASREIQWRRA